jgi:hypothetical protein
VIEVAGDVGVVLARAEELRTLARDGEQTVGDFADIVFSAGIAIAVADAAHVLGLDVRDAVGRAADFSFKAVVSRALLARAVTGCER